MIEINDLYFFSMPCRCAIINLAGFLHKIYILSKLKAVKKEYTKKNKEVLKLKASGIKIFNYEFFS